VVKTKPAFDQDTVLVFQNSAWTPYTAVYPAEGGRVDASSNLLIYRDFSRVTAFDDAGNMSITIGNSELQNGNLMSGLVSNGVFWLADNNNGLVKKTNNPLEVKTISPNGPKSESVWAMDSRKGNLWVASGALLGDAPSGTKYGTYLFSDNTWKIFDPTNDSVYLRMTNSGYSGLICVAVDPQDPEHAYVGSWGGGMLEYRSHGAVKWHNRSNSALEDITGLPNYIITGGLAFDEDNNLWVVAGGNPNPLAEFFPDGTSRNYHMPESELTGYGLYGMVIDDYKNKWFFARSGASNGAGLVVYNENDPSTDADDSYMRLTDKVGKGALPDIFVSSIAKDKDGSIWIGTNQGVGVIYNPGNVFGGGSFDAQKIIIEFEGYTQYLLAGTSHGDNCRRC